MTTPASVIISTESPFARDVFTKRHPALIDRVMAAFPFGREQRQALALLAEENVSGVIEPLPGTAVDAEQWTAWGAGFYGQPWAAVPFLWAESYFYRRLLEATGFFSEGPWRGVDPFAPFKHAELAGEQVAEELRALDGWSGLPEEQRAGLLLQSSLWGNRADLALEITEGSSRESSGLVADDSVELWRLLEEGRGGTVVLVADNAGRELLPDLVLIDHLLASGLADTVELHVKPSPYYVSDATPTDVAECVQELLRGQGEARTVGLRLREAAAAGQLRVRTHAFYCAPLDFSEMPADLAEQFAAATVTILKGDLNYRRLVGDRWWQPTTTFADVTSYVPGRVAALRTLKSDVVVGLTMETVCGLDASGSGWRTDGTHGLVQVR